MEKQKSSRPVGKTKGRDGIYSRADRPGEFWGSWTDALGRRRRRRFKVNTHQQAQAALAAERLKVERHGMLGHAEPTEDTFGAVVPRYLKHQQPRISQRSYERTSGILENHLRPVFGAMRLSEIRRVHIQQYMTERAVKVSAASVVKELNVVKHLMGLAVEWELIPFSPAFKIKAPRLPAGRVRYLQPTELRALLADCPDWLRPIAGLAGLHWYAAQRDSESPLAERGLAG